MNYHSGFVRANAIIILSSLCTILLTVFAVLPCHGESVDSKPPTLTLKVENLPLEDVLKRISHDQSFEIIVNPPWGKVPLTLNFKDIPLEESIRKIIQALGRPSHFIVTNKKDKKVTLLISGLPAGSPVTSMGDKTASLDDKGAIPFPGSQKGFLTAAKLDAIIDKHKNHWTDLPKDTVIGPPSTSGGPGLTIGQLEAIKKEQEEKLETLPSNTIIGPPSTSGGPGLTVVQLEAIKKEYEEKRKAQPEIMIIKRLSGSEATENTAGK